MSPRNQSSSIEQEAVPSRCIPVPPARVHVLPLKLRIAQVDGIAIAACLLRARPVRG